MTATTSQATGGTKKLTTAEPEILLEQEHSEELEQDIYANEEEENLENARCLEAYRAAEKAYHEEGSTLEQDTEHFFAGEKDRFLAWLGSEEDIEETNTAAEDLEQVRHNEKASMMERTSGITWHKERNIENLVADEVTEGGCYVDAEKYDTFDGSEGSEAILLLKKVGGVQGFYQMGWRQAEEHHAAVAAELENQRARAAQAQRHSGPNNRQHFQQSWTAGHMRNSLSAKAMQSSSWYWAHPNGKDVHNMYQEPSGTRSLQEAQAVNPRVHPLASIRVDVRGAREVLRSRRSHYTQTKSIIRHLRNSFFAKAQRVGSWQWARPVAPENITVHALARIKEDISRARNTLRSRKTKFTGTGKRRNRAPELVVRRLLSATDMRNSFFAKAQRAGSWHWAHPRANNGHKRNPEPFDTPNIHAPVRSLARIEEDIGQAREVLRSRQKYLKTKLRRSGTMHRTQCSSALDCYLIRPGALQQNRQGWKLFRWIRRHVRRAVDWVGHHARRAVDWTWKRIVKPLTKIPNDIVKKVTGFDIHKAIEKVGKGIDLIKPLAKMIDNITPLIACLNTVPEARYHVGYIFKLVSDNSADLLKLAKVLFETYVVPLVRDIGQALQKFVTTGINAVKSLFVGQDKLTMKDIFTGKWIDKFMDKVWNFLLQMSSGHGLGPVKCLLQHLVKPWYEALKSLVLDVTRQILKLVEMAWKNIFKKAIIWVSKRLMEWMMKAPFMKTVVGFIVDWTVKKCMAKTDLNAKMIEAFKQKTSNGTATQKEFRRVLRKVTFLFFPLPDSFDLDGMEQLAGEGIDWLVDRGGDAAEFVLEGLKAVVLGLIAEVRKLLWKHVVAPIMRLIVDILMAIVHGMQYLVEGLFGLIPFAGAICENVAGEILQAVENFVSSRLTELAQHMFNEVFKAIGNLAGTLAGLAMNAVQKALGLTKDALKGAVKKVVGVGKQAIKGVKSLTNKIFGGLDYMLKPLEFVVSEFMDIAKQSVPGLADKMRACDSTTLAMSESFAASWATHTTNSKTVNKLRQARAGKVKKNKKMRQNLKNVSKLAKELKQDTRDLEMKLRKKERDMQRQKQAHAAKISDLTQERGNVKKNLTDIATKYKTEAKRSEVQRKQLEDAIAQVKLEQMLQQEDDKSRQSEEKDKHEADMKRETTRTEAAKHDKQAAERATSLANGRTERAKKQTQRDKEDSELTQRRLEEKKEQLSDAVVDFKQDKQRSESEKESLKAKGDRLEQEARYLSRDLQKQDRMIRKAKEDLRQKEQKDTSFVNGLFR